MPLVTPVRYTSLLIPSTLSLSSSCYSSQLAPHSPHLAHDTPLPLSLLTPHTSNLTTPHTTYFTPHTLHLTRTYTHLTPYTSHAHTHTHTPAPPPSAAPTVLSIYVLVLRPCRPAAHKVHGCRFLQVLAARLHNPQQRKHSR